MYRYGSWTIGYPTTKGIADCICKMSEYRISIMKITIIHYTLYKEFLRITSIILLLSSKKYLSLRSIVYNIFYITTP